MTLPDFTSSRLGQANASGSTTALFLKVFAGEVMATFQETNVMSDKHIVRSISEGYTAQFPVLGTTTAAYHTPGTMIDGNAIKANEKTINIDGLLISPAFVSNWDEMINHYDVRGEYASILGRSLAVKYDKQVLQLAVLAARAAATISGGNGGSILTNAAFDTDGEAIADGLFDAAQTLDEKDVPKEDRFFICKPRHYYLLSRSTKVLNKDWGGSGSLASGRVMECAGFKIVESNNVPNSNISADSPAPNNTYHANFASTTGVAIHRSAVGTVKRLDLAVEQDYLVQNQGTLMVAKMAVGHGILRPECAVEFVKA